VTIEKLETGWYRRDKGLQELGYTDRDEIRALLLGRRVVEVDNDHMRLDNGTIVAVLPNNGGCSCGAGDYGLTELNTVDNVITKVEFECDPIDEFDAYAYRIFVFADNERINLLAVEGDDGNGYYGTGYELLVKPVAQDLGQAA
jgi:hypothetical protein